MEQLYLDVHAPFIVVRIKRTFLIIVTTNHERFSNNGYDGNSQICFKQNNYGLKIQKIKNKLRIY